MKKCRKCGYIEEDNSIPFCTYCGHPIAVLWRETETIKEDNELNQSKKKISKKVKVTALSIFIIAIIVGTSFYVFTAQSTTITITSVSSSSGGYSSLTSGVVINRYSLTINITINFPESKKIDGSNLGCSLSFNIPKNSKFTLTQPSHSNPDCFYLAHYKGPYSFMLYSTLSPINSSDISHPFTFQFSVTSSMLHITSNRYTVTIP